MQQDTVEHVGIAVSVPLAISDYKHCAGIYYCCYNLREYFDLGFLADIQGASVFLNSRVLQSI